MQVAKCLIVHVLSSSYNGFSFELSDERKTTQQWGPRFANDIILIQVCVYHQRVHADIVASRFWFVRSFSYQFYSKFATINTFKNLSQIFTKECQARSFKCNVKFNFSCSSRHFNCDTIFAVITSFLNEFSLLQQYA